MEEPKKGDRVTILKPVDGNTWVDNMYGLIGSTGTICCIQKSDVFGKLAFVKFNEPRVRYVYLLDELEKVGEHLKY